MATIRLENIVKKYGNFEAVHGISLNISHHEFVAFVGPSGCGKSTTLRMIAGLEEISAGTIWIGPKVVNNLPPRDRNISMVFQNYALYPHMNVFNNLGFGLKIAKQPQKTINKQVQKAAEILGLEDLMERMPSELSGGQRQRVAMGRAIVRQPEVFLFDEPLSNLDAKLRVQMRIEIKKLHQKVKTTVVYVTHDQVEAMTLADRIVVMKNGYIEQVGTPMEIFNHPCNTFVASFIGSPPMNLIPAIMQDGKLVFSDSIAFSLPQSLAQSLANNIRNGQKVVVGIRPDDLTLEGHGIVQNKQTVSLRLKVELAELLGTETILYTQIGKQKILGKMFNPRKIVAGEIATFNFCVDKIHLFDIETQKSLSQKSLEMC